MGRHRLSDDEWNCLAELFPEPAPTGRPPREHRLMVDGALWVLETGAPWRDLPQEFGPWQTVYDRFNRWSADGTWDQILKRLRADHVQAGLIDEDLWCVDGTVIRAARCAAGGGKKGARRSQKTMP